MSLSISSALPEQAAGVSSAGHSANASGANPAERAKLQKAAGEFESILLQTLWKSMKQTFSDPDDQDSDPTLEDFDNFGMQAMAGVVGNSGVLGIKRLILKHLEPTLTGGQTVNTAA